jgi:hypothetical protein
MLDSLRAAGSIALRFAVSSASTKKQHKIWTTSPRPRKDRTRGSPRHLASTLFDKIDLASRRYPRDVELATEPDMQFWKLKP